MTTTRANNFEIRRARERGTTQLGWLNSRHSFSFGHYYDPQRLGYRSLRVLNDDIVQPGAGFGEHGHDNMEIISWVLDGALEHHDSTGTRGVIRPGELQMMSAGRGIRHSEMNASQSDPAHFLQIWIEPAERDLAPAYAQESFPRAERRNQWQLVVSPDGRDGSIRIHQDAVLSITHVEKLHGMVVALDRSRYGYLHVAFGSVRIGEESLLAGDAIVLSGPARLELEALEDSELLLFDLC